MSETTSLTGDLQALADRYIDAAHGDQLAGLTRLGEDLLQYADRRTAGEHDWASLFYRLKKLSG